MYPALQSYFMSIDKPPVVLKWFYESSVNKLYLNHLQSFVVIFNKQVQNIKRSTASITEVKACLDAVKSTIKERQKQLFISTKIKLKQSILRDEGHNHECDRFISDASALYKSCVEYLKNGQLHLRNSNALIGCFCCKKLSGKMSKHLLNICIQNCSY